MRNGVPAGLLRARCTHQPPHSDRSPLLRAAINLYANEGYLPAYYALVALTSLRSPTVRPLLAHMRAMHMLNQIRTAVNAFLPLSRR